MTSAPAAGAGRRVGFLIAGVQKAGTTSLHAMLAQHPQIARARKKELHFFEDERRDWSRPRYRAYHRRFTWQASARVAGEATPIYVFWPGAMERIKLYNPGMRIVLSFRDPVERAFSQWRMEHDRREGIPAFAEAIRRNAAKRWPRTVQEAGPPFLSFVTRGYYGQQLAHVLELFPPTQVLALDYHRMFDDVPATLDAITDLIGVDRFAEAPDELHERIQPRSAVGLAPHQDDVTLLVERYADDLAMFGRLSGLDVSSWPTARVIDGSITAAELADALAARNAAAGS